MNGPVFVIDNHVTERASLMSNLVDLNFQVVGYQSNEHFLSEFNDAVCGCVMTEFLFPGMSGFGLMEKLRRDDHLAIPTLIITSFTTTKLTLRALRDGACSVLDNPADETILSREVERALRLGAERKRCESESSALEERFITLTRGEWEVLVCILEGETSQRIASKLSLSTRTVETKRQRIFRKTQADSVADLLRMAVKSEHCTTQFSHSSLQRLL